MEILQFKSHLPILRNQHSSITAKLTQLKGELVATKSEKENIWKKAESKRRKIQRSRYKT